MVYFVRFARCSFALRLTIFIKKSSFAHISLPEPPGALKTCLNESSQNSIFQNSFQYIHRQTNICLSYSSMSSNYRIRKTNRANTFNTLLLVCISIYSKQCIYLCITVLFFCIQSWIALDFTSS